MPTEDSLSKHVQKSAILFLLCGVGLLACKRQQETAPVKIIPVELAEVTREQIAQPVRAVGTAAYEQQMRLAFKTGGFVTLLVRDGQTVAAGQTLARLDLSEIEAQVAQANSAFDKAQRDYERVKRLYEEGAATQEQFQNVETALQMAASSLKIAQFNLQHSTITAPTEGTILRQFVESGELVGPGTPIFYFGSGSRPCLIRVSVSAINALRLRSGDRAVAQFDAYPVDTFFGVISKIARAADPQTGLFDIEIRLHGCDRPLGVGMVATCSLFPSDAPIYTLIPVEAVVEADGDRGFVFTVAEGIAHKRSITIGPMFGERIAATLGLENVDRVIAAGAALLRDGDRVEIR